MMAFSKGNGTMSKKTKVVIILLIGVLVILASLLITAWCMFGTQLKAVSTIEKLEDHLYAIEYTGDYGFEGFLAQGGAATDGEMADYIATFLSHGFWKPEDTSMPGLDFGCSTITVKDSTGDMIFGRNYDWADCEAMIVHTIPENGYESVSTCCLDFLGFGKGWVPEGMTNKMMSLSAVYVPLDGMNEKGLCVADLMAGDDVETHQNTEKPDLTVTPMIRLLLDQAATVEEAVDLLAQYDMHSSIGAAHHLSIADATGRSVAIEYIDDKMQVIETPILTNHYLTQGDKYGVGSQQSHQRFDRLMERYTEEKGIMSLEEVVKSLQSVTQETFPDSNEGTQWTIVYSPSALTADYYFRTNYEQKYTTMLLNQDGWIDFQAE